MNNSKMIYSIYPTSQCFCILLYRCKYTLRKRHYLFSYFQIFFSHTAFSAKAVGSRNMKPNQFSCSVNEENWLNAYALPTTNVSVNVSSPFLILLSRRLSQFTLVSNHPPLVFHMCQSLPASYLTEASFQISSPYKIYAFPKKPNQSMWQDAEHGQVIAAYRKGK